MNEVKKYNNVTVNELQDILNTHINDKPTLYKMYKEKQADKLDIIDEAKYSKRVFMKGKKFRHDLDIMSVVLDDDKTYSIKEVTDMIIKFKNRKVVDN